MNLLKVGSELFLNFSSSFVCSGTRRAARSLSWFSDWTRSVQRPDLLALFGDRKDADGEPIHDLDQLGVNISSRLSKHWQERSLEYCSLEHWKDDARELSCSGFG
jgi:hypothetical protein